MREKKGFLFFHSWKKMTDLMTDEELRRFINNLFDYDLGKQTLFSNREEEIAWNGILGLLELNKNKYNYSRTNGKLGGAPTGNKNAKKQPKQPKTT